MAGCLWFHQATEFTVYAMPALSLHHQSSDDQASQESPLLTRSSCREIQVLSSSCHLSEMATVLALQISASSTSLSSHQVLPTDSSKVPI